MIEPKQVPSSLSCMPPVPFPAWKTAGPVPFPVFRPVAERELSYISRVGVGKLGVSYGR